MITIKVTLENGDVVISGLDAYSDAIRKHAIPRALRDIAKGINKEAVKRLSGPAVGLRKTKSKTGKQRTAPQRPELAGGYPVPRWTGHLRRMMRWLGPGKTAVADNVYYSTDPMSALVYNPVEYAAVIHEGKHTSKKYGPRRFLDDAFEEFNQGARIERLIRDRLEEAKRRSGLE